jgi:hypothetical protein
MDRDYGVTSVVAVGSGVLVAGAGVLVGAGLLPVTLMLSESG